MSEVSNKLLPIDPQSLNTKAIVQRIDGSLAEYRHNLEIPGRPYDETQEIRGAINARAILREQCVVAAADEEETPEPSAMGSY